MNLSTRRIRIVLFAAAALLATSFSTPTPADDGKVKKAQLAEVPPLFVTHEGVAYNFTRENFGAWKAAAVKDGKTLWEKKVLPHKHAKPGDAPDEITQVEMRNGFNAIPKSGWYVGFKSYRLEGGLSLDQGEIVRFIGFGRGVPPKAVPHELMPKPPAGKPKVHTVEVKDRTYTARSDGDMLGPWNVTCTDAAKKVIWERKLPRGIWISGMKKEEVERIMNAEPFETKMFTLLDLEGSRRLLILTDTGDVVGHESYKK